MPSFVVIQGLLVTIKAGRTAHSRNDVLRSIDLCLRFFFPLFSSKPLKCIQVLGNGKRREQTGKPDSLDSLEGTACTPFARAAGRI